MDLETARKEYKNGSITFNELDHIFSLKATNKELNDFMKTPVYDRPNFIIGKNQKQMDDEWETMLKRNNE
jgi:hypothetical protein